MKKSFTAALALVFALVMTVSLFAPAASAASKTWAVGDTGYMGMYPQTQVTDTDLLSKLNAQTLNWVSYGYYSGTGSDGTMVSGDWMKYADVNYGGNKYRAVTFSQYRPISTERTSSTDNTYQDDNGYTTGNTYWFKYEPIAWKVLDPSEGLVMSEMLLDSQAYSNTIYKSGDGYYNDSASSVYANDYVTSSIRKWLNDDFYNTAFTSDEQAAIQTTTLDNSDYDTANHSEYNSASTSDKIFLLSYAEAHNSAYGFDGGTSYSSTRYAKGTDYAKSQGLWVLTVTSYSGNSNWRLRSPGSYSYGACGVGSCGYLFDNDYVCFTYDGVRAAFNTNLLSSTFKSSGGAGVSGSDAQTAHVTGSSGTQSSTTSGSKVWNWLLVVAAAVVVIVIVVNKKGSSGGSNRPGNNDGYPPQDGAARWY